MRPASRGRLGARQRRRGRCGLRWPGAGDDRARFDGDERAERRSLDVLHDELHVRPDGLHLAHLDDVRVVQRRGDARLAEQGGALALVLEDVGVRPLERDEPARAATHEDRGRAARGDLRQRREAKVRLVGRHSERRADRQRGAACFDPDAHAGRAVPSRGEDAERGRREREPRGRREEHVGAGLIGEPGGSEHRALWAVLAETAIVDEDVVLVRGVRARPYGQARGHAGDDGGGDEPSRGEAARRGGGLDGRRRGGRGGWHCGRRGGSDLDGLVGGYVDEAGLGGPVRLEGDGVHARRDDAGVRWLDRPAVDGRQAGDTTGATHDDAPRSMREARARGRDDAGEVGVGRCEAPGALEELRSEDCVVGERRRVEGFAERHRVRREGIGRGELGGGAGVVSGPVRDRAPVVRVLRARLDGGIPVGARRPREA